MTPPNISVASELLASGGGDFYADGTQAKPERRRHVKKPDVASNCEAEAKPEPSIKKKCHRQGSAATEGGTEATPEAGGARVAEGNAGEAGVPVAARSPEAEEQRSKKAEAAT